MKKYLILILGLIVAGLVESHAQYVFPSEITSKGSKIIAGDSVLTPQQAAVLFSEFGGSQMGTEYLENVKGRKSGVTMISVGAPMVAVGYVTCTVGGLLGLSQDLGHTPEAVYYTGAAVAISGAVLTLWGIRKTTIYKRRIKKTVAEYNEAIASRQTVSFAPATSGIGIAMYF